MLFRSEIQPQFGRSRITGLARVDGYPVGVMINNPQYLGGSMDKDAGEKTARLVQLCDTFHLPLVALAIAWRIYPTGREFVLPRSPGRTRALEESLNQLRSDESIESDLQRLKRLESSGGDRE